MDGVGIEVLLGPEVGADVALEPWVRVAEAAEEPGAGWSARPGDDDPQAVLGAGEHGGGPDRGGERLGVVTGERVDVLGGEGDLVGARRPGPVEDLEEPRLAPAERRRDTRIARKTEPVEEWSGIPALRSGAQPDTELLVERLEQWHLLVVVAVAKRVAERVELRARPGRCDPPQEVDGAGDVVHRRAGQGGGGGGNGELGVEQPRALDRRRQPAELRGDAVEPRGGCPRSFTVERGESVANLTENADRFLVPERLEVGDERVEWGPTGDRDRQRRDENLGVGQLLDEPGGPVGIHAADGDGLGHLGEGCRGTCRLECTLQVWGVRDLKEVVAALEPVEA